MTEQLPLSLPKDRKEIDALQRRQKVHAVENAKKSAYWKDALSGIHMGRLDDPEEWRKIPILEKDALRQMSAEEFYGDFCIASGAEICEFWRSGGSTGKPLFYPKTYEDIRYNMIGFTRTFECSGTVVGHVAHNSFPLGIHPAGHMWARAGRILDIGMVWSGAGTGLPSAAQLQLIRDLKPTLWMGMSSYGLHLANLAQSEGYDLSASSVNRILCTAEPVSNAKRAKLEREWGADMFDCFGMTEVSMMGAESDKHDGFHIWTDLAYIEVVDEETKKPVAEGEPGLLIVTPMFSNNGAPFLRWNSGDVVTYRSEGATGSDFAVFPVIEHAHRTAGFFKVRGVNINHQDFEDFLFENAAVMDFKAEALESQDGNDVFMLSIEARRGADEDQLRVAVMDGTKTRFELTPEVEFLAVGALAKEFETSVKAPRFTDRRG
jgi:phenylacetate-CoA ligase